MNLFRRSSGHSFDQDQDHEAWQLYMKRTTLSMHLDEWFVGLGPAQHARGEAVYRQALVLKAQVDTIEWVKSMNDTAGAAPLFSQVLDRANIFLGAAALFWCILPRVHRSETACRMWVVGWRASWGLRNGQLPLRDVDEVDVLRTRGPPLFWVFVSPPRPLFFGAFGSLVWVTVRVPAFGPPPAPSRGKWPPGCPKTDTFLVPLLKAAKRQKKQPRCPLSV